MNKKETLKTIILTAIITTIVVSAVGVVAVTLSAKDVGFTSSNSEWQVDNVEDAVNELYKYSKTDILDKLTLSSKDNISYGDRNADRTVNLELEAGSYLILASQSVTTSSYTPNNSNNPDIAININYSSGNCKQISTNQTTSFGSEFFSGSIYAGTALVNTFFKCKFEEKTNVTVLTNTTTETEYGHVLYGNALRLD